MGYKLVLDEQSDSVVIGVGKDGCDPKTFRVLNADDGNAGCLWALEPSDRWATAVASLPQLLRVAEGEWEGNPLNPKYVAPAKTTAKAKGAAPAAPAAAATAAEPPAEELPLLDQQSEEAETMTNPVAQDPEEETQETQGAAQDPQDAQETTADPPAGQEDDAQQAEAATANAHPWVNTEPVVGPALSSVDKATAAMETATAAMETPAEADTPAEAETPAAADQAEPETPAEPETLAEAETPEPAEPPETPAAPAAATNGGAWRYYVDGVNTNAEGYATVHEALRALDVTQADIDNHKYWHRYDRLPKLHTDRIRRERVDAA